MVDPDVWRCEKCGLEQAEKPTAIINSIAEDLAIFHGTTMLCGLGYTCKGFHVKEEGLEWADGSYVDEEGRVCYAEYKFSNRNLPPSKFAHNLASFNRYAIPGEKLNPPLPRGVYHHKLTNKIFKVIVVSNRVCTKDTKSLLTRLGWRFFLLKEFPLKYQAIIQLARRYPREFMAILRELERKQIERRLQGKRKALRGIRAELKEADEAHE